jgi:hypothetical protein
MLLNHAGPNMEKLLRMAGSDDQKTFEQGVAGLAKAVEVPLQQGFINGDIYSDLFQKESVASGSSGAAEYPLDLLAPGTEGSHVAFTMPGTGRVPNRFVDGDYVMVPLYEVGNGIDFSRRYAEECRWNIVERALEVLEGGFVRKFNTDAWRVVIESALSRSLMVFDDRVAPGYTSKRLVELGKQVMRRQGGGNGSSVNRFRLGRMYVSPEAAGDVRNWNVDEVDPWTRREIYLNDDLDAMRVFGVDIRTLDELGVGQEFQNFFAARGGTLPTYSLSGSKTKLELAIGVDPNKKNGFIMPVRQNVQIYEDVSYFRAGKVSLFGKARVGFASLENRGTIAMAI